MMCRARVRGSSARMSAEERGAGEYFPFCYLAPAQPSRPVAKDNAILTLSESWLSYSFFPVMLWPLPRGAQAVKTQSPPGPQHRQTLLTLHKHTYTQAYGHTCETLLSHDDEDVVLGVVNVRHERHNGRDACRLVTKRKRLEVSTSGRKPMLNQNPQGSPSHQPMQRNSGTLRY